MTLPTGIGSPSSFLLLGGGPLFVNLDLWIAVEIEVEEVVPVAVPIAVGGFGGGGGGYPIPHGIQMEPIYVRKKKKVKVWVKLVKAYKVDVAADLMRHFYPEDGNA